MHLTIFNRNKILHKNLKLEVKSHIVRYHRRLNYSFSSQRVCPQLKATTLQATAQMSTVETSNKKTAQRREKRIACCVRTRRGIEDEERTRGGRSEVKGRSEIKM